MPSRKQSDDRADFPRTEQAYEPQQSIESNFPWQDGVIDLTPASLASFPFSAYHRSTTDILSNKLSKISLSLEHSNTPRKTPEIHEIHKYQTTRRNSQELIQVGLGPYLESPCPPSADCAGSSNLEDGENEDTQILEKDGVKPGIKREAPSPGLAPQRNKTWPVEASWGCTHSPAGFHLQRRALKNHTWPSELSGNFDSGEGPLVRSFEIQLCSVGTDTLPTVRWPKLGCPTSSCENSNGTDGRLPLTPETRECSTPLVETDDTDDEEIESVDDDRLFAAQNSVANSLLCAFLRTCVGGPSKTNKRSRGRSPDIPSKGHQKTDPCRKRRKRTNQDDADESDAEERDSNTGHGESSESALSEVACIFNKFDRHLFGHGSPERRYHGCTTFKAPTIALLKQHLERVHLQPEFFCPRCGQAFESTAPLQAHQRQEQLCETRHPAPFQERISRELAGLLGLLKTKKKNPRISTVQCWFDMYDKCFPSPKRKEDVTPWVEHPDEPLLRDLRDYFDGRIHTLASLLQPALDEHWVNEDAVAGIWPVLVNHFRELRMRTSFPILPTLGVPTSAPAPSHASISVPASAPTAPFSFAWSGDQQLSHEQDFEELDLWLYEDQGLLLDNSGV